MKKINKFLNNEKKYIPLLAAEIAENFETQANEDNVEYNFVIDGENKKIKTLDPNTYFFFDTNGQTVLHDFKKALFDEDLADIAEGSQAEKVLMEKVREFLLKVSNKITKKYADNLRETIRRVVLGGKYGEERVPLSKIEVISIDIADYASIPESHKYIMKIGKKPGTDTNTDEIIKFIQSRQEKTGMDISTIFSIEQKAGNSLFENVLAVEAGQKFLNEISIYFFVDYSVNIEEKIT
jgi:hypothetical protein